jgi:hypothetical protein
MPVQSVIAHGKSRMIMRIKPINPIARQMALNRRRAQVVQPKKGKGSYNRNKAKEQNNAEARDSDISKD